jgi:hypothetical protein
MFWLLLVSLVFGGIFILIVCSMIIPSHICAQYTIPKIIHYFSDTHVTHKWGSKWILKTWSSEELQNVYNLHVGNHRKFQDISEDIKTELCKLIILMIYGGLFIDHTQNLHGVCRLEKYFHSEYFISFHQSHNITLSIMASAPNSIIMKDILKSLTSKIDIQIIQKQIARSCINFKTSIIDIDILR